MKNEQLSQFFATQALYSPLLLSKNYTTAIGVEGPFDFQGTTFTYYCNEEHDTRTFEIELPKSSANFWGSQMGGVVPKEVLKEGRLDFTHHLIGKCRSCKNYHIDFLVRIWSTDKISTDLLEGARIFYQKDKPKIIEEANTISNSVFIEKIGLNPENTPTVDKQLSRYFDRNTNSLYYKGKKALNENLGIGSFAYFRRIVEKELVNIVTDISTLNSSDSETLKSILAEYRKSNKTHILYDNTFQYLPKSLQALGDNPLKVLYQQISEGLHNLTEEQCLERANHIDTLLKFIIRKINEEKSDILEARNALKALTK